jgi:hypothetical protein
LSVGLFVAAALTVAEAGCSFLAVPSPTLPPPKRLSVGLFVAAALVATLAVAAEDFFTDFCKRLIVGLLVVAIAFMTIGFVSDL